MNSVLFSMPYLFMPVYCDGSVLINCSLTQGGEVGVQNLEGEGEGIQ